MRSKKIVASVMALMMVFGAGSVIGSIDAAPFVVTASAAPLEEYGGFEYTVEETGSITIRGYKGTDTDVTIPDTIDGKKVTIIGVEAFKSNTDIKSVTVPESVRYIMENAFNGCSALETVTLPTFLSSVGDSAFLSCPSLKSVKIPDQCTEIGSMAFGYTRKFSQNKNGKGLHVTYPKVSDFKIFCYPNSPGETYAKDNEFDYEYLNYVHGDYEYRSNPDKSVVIMKYNGNAESLNIANDFSSDEVREIADNAFDGTKSANTDIKLSSVKLPETLTKIGERSFYACPNMQNITIPQSVTEIGDKALGYRQGITSVIPLKMGAVKIKNFTIYGHKDSAAETYAKDNGFTFVYIAGDYQYKLTEDGAEIVKFTGYGSDVMIPDKLEDNAVTAIGEGAFMGVAGTKTITVPDGVTKIGANAFINCANLTEITLPKSVTDIGEKSIGYYSLLGQEDKVKTAIKGYKNTAAEKYAKDNELEFIPLDEDKNDDSTTSKTDSTESKNDGKKDDSSKADSTDSKDSGKKDDSSKADSNDSKDSSKKEDSSKTDNSNSKNSGKPDDTSKPDDTQTTDQDTTSGEDESFLKGDVNGDGYINVTDIALVASHIKGIKPLSDNGLKAADVNEDTKVNVTDIALIAAHIKGIKAIV